MSVRNQPKIYEANRRPKDGHPLFCFISFIVIYYPLTDIVIVHIVLQSLRPIPPPIHPQRRQTNTPQAYYFQMISEMSENDLKTLGHSVGFSPVLDNPRSARYNPVQGGAVGHSGNVLCNNRPFSSTSEYQIASADSTSLNNVANIAIQHKLSRYVDTSMSLVQNGIYGAGNTLMTVTNLASEFRPYYEEKSGTDGRYMLWYAPPKCRGGWIAVRASLYLSLSRSLARSLSP